MTTTRFYPVGTPGQPWGDAERAQWLAAQKRQRSYRDDVLDRVDALRDHYDVKCYGELDYAGGKYPLNVLRSKKWDASLPVMLVSGGVHGYETSGVHGALLFAERDAERYAGRANLVIVPCVCPWGYEHIHRWTPLALDPNRNFREQTPVTEAALFMSMLGELRDVIAMHIDLHETTDTDESEFRPALAARDGKPYEPGTIPDGFYLCGDTVNLEPAFQRAIIEAVARVTHIAPADANGMIIESPVVAPGVIAYPLAEWGLCAGVTSARFRTTTEVYPDSRGVTDEECNEAQVAAVCAAIDYALAHG